MKQLLFAIAFTFLLFSNNSYASPVLILDNNFSSSVFKQNDPIYQSIENDISGSNYSNSGFFFVSAHAGNPLGQGHTEATSRVLFTPLAEFNEFNYYVNFYPAFSWITGSITDLSTNTVIWSIDQNHNRDGLPEGRISTPFLLNHNYEIYLSANAYSHYDYWFAELSISGLDPVMPIIAQEPPSLITFILSLPFAYYICTIKRKHT